MNSIISSLKMHSVIMYMNRNNPKPEK